MSDATERLKAWIRDYGHLKEPPFIAALEAVLAENSELRKRLEEAEQHLNRLREAFAKYKRQSLDWQCGGYWVDDRGHGITSPPPQPDDPTQPSVASLTAQLATAEAEIKRRNDYDERVPDPRHYKYFNFDCTTGCKWLVAQREVAELRELVEACREVIVEQNGDGVPPICGLCNEPLPCRHCGWIPPDDNVLDILEKIARLTPAKPAAVEGGAE